MKGQEKSQYLKRSQEVQSWTHSNKTKTSKCLELPNRNSSKLEDTMLWIQICSSKSMFCRTIDQEWAKMEMILILFYSTLKTRRRIRVVSYLWLALRRSFTSLLKRKNLGRVRLSLNMANISFMKRMTGKISKITLSNSKRKRSLTIENRIAHTKRFFRTHWTQ